MELLFISFLQGVITFFAPCAVVLLPGYIASFISRESTKHAALKRGFTLGSMIILGFALIYLFAGLLLIGASQLIKTYIPYIAFGMGILVIILGVLMLLGKNVSLQLHFRQKKTDSEIAEAFLFGVAYGIGALGCLFPLFLLVINAALAETTLIMSALHFVMYVLGMSLLMITVITLTIVAREWLSKTLSSIMPHLTKIAGTVMILAGIYIMRYQSALLF